MRITGIPANTRVSARMVVTNGVDLESESEEFVVTTLEAADNEPPVNTPLAITARSDNSITAEWDTKNENEIANSIV